MLTADKIIKKLDQWQTERDEPIVPTDNDVAQKKLLAAKLTEDEITAKKDMLNPSEARIVANYTDLHGLDHLDAIDKNWDENIADKASQSVASQPNVQYIRTIMQAAEIAVLNLDNLAQRATIDINEGNLGDAADKQAWMDSLQGTLVNLSQLAGKYRPIDQAERTLNFNDSPHLGYYTESLEAFHKAIEKAGLTTAEEIGSKNNHDDGRRISFNAFNNETYEGIWRMHLGDIPIPAISGAEELDNSDFYQQFVGTNSLERAVNEVTQKGDNFFTEFRCYHQMTEVLTQYANRQLADTIRALVDPESNTIKIEAELKQTSEALGLMVENVHPILRNLVPHKYQNIRGSLGITSGSHSPNVRKGLFMNTYPLLAEAATLHMTNGKVLDDDALGAHLQAIADNRFESHEDNLKYKIMEHVQDISQTLSMWRNLHMQFVDTQIGISHKEGESTASISGARNASKSAEGMRAHGQKIDPIGPIDKALTQQDEPQRIPSHESPFSQLMAGSTATAVETLSEEVQSRVNR